jgi:hypothetical protein
MATAHGAGLMSLPLFVIGGTAAPACHARAGLALSAPAAFSVRTLVHTTAMLLSTGAIALVVCHRFGLRLLRRAWFNLDWLWASALIASGVAAIFV